jgi:hypothetical protein
MKKDEKCVILVFLLGIMRICETSQRDKWITKLMIGMQERQRGISNVYRFHKWNKIVHFSKRTMISLYNILCGSNSFFKMYDIHFKIECISE